MRRHRKNYLKWIPPPLGYRMDHRFLILSAAVAAVVAAAADDDDDAAVRRLG